MQHEDCPCGSGKTYATCCGIYHTQQAYAPTPEALMRSRYSAYFLHNIDYIVRTMLGEALEGFDKSSALQWTKQIQWQGLKIINAYQEGLRGFVEFKAYYIQNKQKHGLHELSEFHYIQGQWYYMDGKLNPSAYSIRR